MTNLEIIFMNACEEGNYNVIEKCLKLGVNPNILNNVNFNFFSPLDLAIEKANNLNVAKLLIKNGANYLYMLNSEKEDNYFYQHYPYAYKMVLDYHKKNPLNALRIVAKEIITEASEANNITGHTQVLAYNQVVELTKKCKGLKPMSSGADWYDWSFKLDNYYLVVHGSIKNGKMEALYNVEIRKDGYHLEYLDYGFQF